MGDFTRIQFRPEQLSAHGLPSIDYPVPPGISGDSLSCAERLPLAAMLSWLQHYSADPEIDWLSLEPAMNRLVYLLARDHPLPGTVFEGDDYRLELSSVAVDRELVAIQRDGLLLAALAPDDEGCLCMASYAPLDAGALEWVVRLAAKPKSRHGVGMCANNWEYALDSAANLENYHAINRSESYLAHHRRGLPGDAGEAAPPEFTAVQLAVYSELPASSP